MRRFTMVLSILGVLALLLAPEIVSAQQKRGLEPEDYYRVRRVGSTNLSPDGRHLLYTVQTVRQQQNDRLTEVWWADLQTGRNQRLSTAGVNTTGPGWTPDGRRIYFNTRRGEESGLHFLNFLEPGGEAYRLPGLDASPNFTLDGRWIIYTQQVSTDPEEEQRLREQTREEQPEPLPFPSYIPGLRRGMDRAWAGTTEPERNLDVYVIAHTNYKRNGSHEFVPPSTPSGGPRDLPPRYTQFFRMPATGLQEGQQPEQLTTDEINKSFQGFTADGRHIIYTAALPESEPPGRAGQRPGSGEDAPQRPGRQAGGRQQGIYFLPIGGGQAEQVATLPSGARSMVISPDGRRFAYIISPGRNQEAVIRVMERSGRQVGEIGADWVYGYSNLMFSRNSREVMWTSSIGGQTQLCKAPATGGEIQRVTQGRHNLGSISFNRDRTMMAYVKDTAEQPWEAFVTDIDGSGERQVSRINTEWMDQVKLSRVERFVFEGVPHNEEWLGTLRERGVEYMMTNTAPTGDRPEIENWLMYPLDFVEGRKYPLVISIHGGPHSRYSETWFPEFQMLAAQGMFVLYMNPRGSGGYGSSFSNMIMEAWGIDDYKDYMQAIDTVVARGIVDTDNMGVTGGSYGGFMTNWITAHDHRFKAALTARSICNWISFYGVSDASGLVEREFGGRPWPFQDPEEGSYDLAMMLSPIVWADRVKTPTLIIHSINDYRCPLEEGEQWFRALKKYNVPVKMVLFPDSDHDLSRNGEPWLLVRRLHEYKDWFRAWLVDDEPPVNAGGLIRR